MSSNVSNHNLGNRTHSAPSTPVGDYYTHSYANASPSLTSQRSDNNNINNTPLNNNASSAFRSILEQKNQNNDHEPLPLSSHRFWIFPALPERSIGVVCNGQLETAINLRNAELKNLLSILNKQPIAMKLIKQLSTEDLRSILNSQDSDEVKANLLAERVDALRSVRLTLAQFAGEDRELKLKDKIKACLSIVAVDGGINFLKYLEIFEKVVKWVGDMDSGYGNDVIVAQNFNEINLKKLERNKDHTDLQEGCEWVFKNHEDKQIIVFGALGNRFDHTLSNLYLLLQKNMHGRVFFYSNDQIVFSLNESNGEIDLNVEGYKTISLISLYELAQGVTVSGCHLAPSYLGHTVKIYHPLSNNKQVKISMKKGELIVCMDKRFIEPFFKKPEELNLFRSVPRHTTSFLLPEPLTTIFEKIFALSPLTKNTPILKGDETIYMMHWKQQQIFDCPKGTTVSLIPIGGAATGLRTKNLAWELGDELKELNKSLVSQSNVAIESCFEVAVDGRGNLLCIITNDIDLEMINLRDDEKLRKGTANNNRNPVLDNLFQNYVPTYIKNNFDEKSKITKNGKVKKYFSVNNNNTNNTNNNSSKS